MLSQRLSAFCDVAGAQRQGVPGGRRAAAHAARRAQVRGPQRAVPVLLKPSGFDVDPLARHQSAAPGEQAGHWGTADLAARAGGMTHGMQGATLDPLLTTAAALRIAPETDTAAWRQAQAEANYARSKVPIGAPVPRGFAVPTDGRAAGGAGSLRAGPPGEAGGARDALRPVDAAAAASGPVRREPGYQGHRAPEADWAKAAQPRDAVFGAPRKGADETAADAMQGDRSGAEPPQRKTPPPSAAAAAAASGAAFGLPPRAGSGSITDSLKMDPEALAAAAARDAEAARRAPAPERNAGVPTFRTDIKQPALRSVADTRAFGDDPPIGTLVAPTASAAAAAAPPMRAGDMMGLLAAAGVPLPNEALFRDIFAAAAAADGLPGGATARLTTFQKIRGARGF
jgi:hypothetical protein